MYKFEIGEFVDICGYVTPKEVLERKFENGQHSYKVYGLSRWYPQYQLSKATAKPQVISMVKVKYEIDGLTFDTMEEAKDHERNIKLFQLIREKSPLIECDTVLLDVLRIFVSERSRVVEIMK